MKNMFNIIRCIVFLAAGLALLLFPYDKFKAIFPNAPSPAAVKIMGIIILLCGVVIVALFSEL